MYWQQRYLEQDKAFIGTSGLDTIDLPNKGLLGCVQLQIFATAGSTEGDRDVGPLDALTKIELIVNGSQVVKSLTGQELKAMMMYQRMAMGQPFMANYLSHVNRVELFINLGRCFHDLEYMLDLSKVNDPELRLEYDFTKTDHHGFENGEAQSSPYRDVICHLLRESDIIPKGYIKTSEIARFLWGSAKKDNLVVPRGPLYSGLYVESYYVGSGITFSLDTIEVNLNNGERVPLRLAMHEFIDIIEATYGRFHVCEVKDLDFVSFFPSPLEAGKVDVQVWGEDLSMMFSLSPAWGQQWGVKAFSDATTPYVTAQKVQLNWDGILPYSIAKIPLYDAFDERTWIETKELGDFHVRYECSAVGSTSCPIKLLGDEVVRQ